MQKLLPGLMLVLVLAGCASTPPEEAPAEAGGSGTSTVGTVTEDGTLTDAGRAGDSRVGSKN